MKMMPCSFDNQEMRWAVDLKEYTIREAWNSAKFGEFRDHFERPAMVVKINGYVWVDVQSDRK